MRIAKKFLFISLLVLSGCSGVPYKNEHLLKSILLYNIQLRRPEYLGADPNALPHEEGFESKPRPDSHLDCQSIKSMFNKVNVAGLRECLASVSKLQSDAPVLSDSHAVGYRLYREILPVFKLEETKSTPFCMKQLLQEIPVPREIFFQSEEDSYLSCFNSRLTIREDEFLGLQSFLNRFKLKINFPLRNLPQNDEETLSLLAAWSLTPFWDTELGVISSVVVPDQLCRQCMGKEKLFLVTDPLPQSLLWK